MSGTHMIRCMACGAINRVPQAKVDAGLEPKCGRCKAALSGATQPVVVTDSNFATVVEHSSQPVLLDLWAPWCEPCRLIGPIIDQLATEMSGKVRVGKINVDENPVTAGRFRVNSIPTLLMFKDGREVDRIVGVPQRADLNQRLSRLASPR